MESSPRVRSGEVSSHIFIILVTLAQLVFFTGFHKYIAWHTTEPDGSVIRLSMLTDDYFVWLPIMITGSILVIITSIAMFYDLEDPIEFTKGIKKILSSDGIWIFEMSYMPTMLKMNSYDTICHEHLEYYSLAVIEYIMKQGEMKIFNASLNPINGGSIRCYASHAKNYSYKNDYFLRNIKTLHQEEFDLELDTDKPYLHVKDHKKKYPASRFRVKKETPASGKKGGSEKKGGKGKKK